MFRSPLCEGPFLCEKCIVSTGNVCKLCDVTRAWHCSLFLAQVAVGNHLNSVKTAFSSTKRIGNLT